ncbi:MAG: BspA family leucine-rich repeat surface protein [Candidatus Gracilibacteria bacterium]|nr:BspA family leucine-rich repeat surface protein [Candidatus Gracilibacteria bacterium]
MNLYKNKIKAFTLVELIVVITILAILGTIAFINLQGYSAGARDSKRLSDVNNLYKKISIERSKGISSSTFIVNGVDIKSGLTVGGVTPTDAKQGNINFLSIKEDNNIFKDPKGNNYVFSYGVGGSGTGAYKFVQLATINEENNQAVIVGDYYQILPTDSPSIILSDSSNLNSPFIEDNKSILPYNIDLLVTSGTNTNCYNPSNIGSVGQAGWLGCEGLLIVENGSGVNGIKTAVNTGIVVGGVTYNATNIFTGQVTDMSNIFPIFGPGFNQDIGYWDTSNVTNMNHMFWGAGTFNQDISNWDVSNVTDMGGMFYGLNNFNQDISNWDTSKVTDMDSLFFNNYSFNQDLSSWDVSNVTDMDYMFDSNYLFNQDISSWNVSSVTSMFWMFGGAQSFNQDISNWNVSNVYDMSYMFYNARAFNQDISNWNVSNVIYMKTMFREALLFNQDISNWNTSKVYHMNEMFYGATSFNQNISGWCVTHVLSKPTNFDATSGFAGNNGIQPQWGTCP